MNTDYIIFCDVYSFEVFRRGENGQAKLIGMHGAYQQAIAPSQYETHLIQSIKHAVGFIKKDWNHVQMPTVACVLSDAYVHTVFHHVTHTFKKDTNISSAMINRAIRADLRARAWDTAKNELPIKDKHVGYVDTVLFGLTVNGYKTSLPLKANTHAREYSFFYGASICSRNIYRRMQDACSRANVSLAGVASFSLATLRTYDHHTLTGAQAIFALQDTVSSVCVIDGPKITLYSIPVGIQSLFTAQAKNHLLLSQLHGVAKRHDQLLDKKMQQWFIQAYEKHHKNHLAFLQHYPIQQLSISIPYIGESNIMIQSAIQKLLYPGASQYTALHQASRMLKRSHVMNTL